MTEEQVKKLLSGELWKNAEDGEAAGRLVARAYAGEMRRLCEKFGLDKAAEGETATEETAKTEEEKVVAKKEEAEKAEADPLLDLVTELGGIA